MLIFDENGFLTPAKAIPGDLELLESEFVKAFNNETRRELFEKLLKYCDDLKKIISSEITIWVNGSFTTKKLIPNDIDIVCFLPGRIAEIKSDLLKNHTYPLAMKSYGIDAYFVKVYEQNDPNHFMTRSDTLHWLHDFTKTFSARRSVKYKKGFLEIKI